MTYSLFPIFVILVKTSYKQYKQGHPNRNLKFLVYWSVFSMVDRNPSVKYGTKDNWAPKPQKSLLWLPALNCTMFMII